MKNVDIRKAAKEAKVNLWEIAEAYGVNDGNFSRKLRRELPDAEKAKILDIIEQIRAQKQTATE
ncbi:MAG: hypothetical protein E7649_07445 [Ruminococcaceae bacterium]|nr:hypothetical protein [Oscillospiraceae bacterium]